MVLNQLILFKIGKKIEYFEKLSIFDHFWVENYYASCWYSNIEEVRLFRVDYHYTYVITIVQVDFVKMY